MSAYLVSAADAQSKSLGGTCHHGTFSWMVRCQVDKILIASLSTLGSMHRRRASSQGHIPSKKGCMKTSSWIVGPSSRIANMISTKSQHSQPFSLSKSDNYFSSTLFSPSSSRAIDLLNHAGVCEIFGSTCHAFGRSIQPWYVVLEALLHSIHLTNTLRKLNWFCSLLC